MSEIRYIALKQFCEFHQVEHHLIIEMAEFGLIDLEDRSDELYLAEPLIPQVERLLRLHVELGVNMAGVETISHMRERMVQMQDELMALRRQLQEFVATYEQDDVEDC